MTTNIALLGHGRMGQVIQECVADAADLSLTGIWTRTTESSAHAQSADLAAVLSAAHVAIDFTLPAATHDIIQAVTKARVPLVCGVSGLPAPLFEQLLAAADEVPVLYDRNMSLGIAVLEQMVRLAGAVLDGQFVAEIHETHHVHKIDAPSGTALKLGEALAASRGQNFSDAYQYDPSGSQQPRQGKIHFESIRHGDAAGEHTVLLKSPDESLSLTHNVGNRRVFALGALRAARWLVNQPPGFYSMQDLVASER